MLQKYQNITRQENKIKHDKRITGVLESIVSSYSISVFLFSLFFSFEKSIPNVFPYELISD